MLSTPSLKSFIPLLLHGQPQALISFFNSSSSLSDPIYSTSSGIVKLHSHLKNLVSFFKQRVISPSQTILREKVDGRRQILEVTVKMNDGMVWDSSTHTASSSDSITVPIALVGEYDEEAEKYISIRIYFGTWAVCNAKPMIRKAPVTKEDPESVQKAFEETPIVKKYFENLIKVNSRR